MRIGIFNNSASYMGGVHQYTLTMVDALAEDSLAGHDLVVFSTMKSPWVRRETKKHGRKFVSVTPFACALEALRSLSVRYIKIGLRYSVSRLLRKPSDQVLHDTFLDLCSRIVKRYNIDLMIYPRIDFETFYNGIPYIVAIHDLAHRIYPQFPEVSSGDLWEWREYFFRNGSKNALAIFVDSEIGKEDVINCYDVSPEKIIPLPFLPPDYLDDDIDDNLLKETKEKFKLPEIFFFYPAQFWKHKNHWGIVHALFHIRERYGENIHVVFCGGKVPQWGEFDRVMKAVQNLGLENQVHYLGYIEDKYIRALYKLALALVMPTYMGPTNIPILEAWELGCPVITSNIRGCREQAINAAVLVDPSDPEDIANGMWKIYNENKFRKRLIAKGKQKLSKWGVNDFNKTVLAAVEYCKKKLEAGEGKNFTLLTLDEIKELKPKLFKIEDQPIKENRKRPSVQIKQYPKISVITPSFNSIRYIEEAIHSVLKQDYPNVEHIIIDGGSTDGTLDILKRYPHLRWLSKPDNGQSDAMNKGFLISTGDVIVYLNADDFFEGGAFFDAVEHLKPENGIKVVAGMCNVAKPDGSVYVPAFVPKVDFFHMMWWWNAWFPINPTGYFYMRDVQERVGGFDESDHYMMDYDFILKVSLNYQIHPVERVWGNFRWLETGKSYTRPGELTRQIVSRKYFNKLSTVEKFKYQKEYLKYKSSLQKGS